MDAEMAGCLYGIGVGPGDPRLITLRAVEVLSKANIVFVPKSADKRASLALQIARPHIASTCRVEELLFPMITDRDELSAHWLKAAEPVSDLLLRGRDCAFITLGDPMLFSTFIYLARAVKQAAPTSRCESIPGIPAAFAAASSGGLALAEGDDRVALITGNDLGKLGGLTGDFQTIIIMKVGARLPAILAELRRLGLADRAVVAHRVGLDGEMVVNADDADNDRLGYLSTIIVRTGS